MVGFLAALAVLGGGIAEPTLIDAAHVGAEFPLVRSGHGGPFEEHLLGEGELVQVPRVRGVPGRGRDQGHLGDRDDGVVREYVLAHCRVDVKVCAIDDTWSGLKHVIRVVDR